jgi:uncharacterized protein with PIN domain
MNKATVREKIYSAIWEGLEPNERRCMAMIMESFICPERNKEKLDSEYEPEFQRLVMDKKDTIASRVMDECRKAALPFRKVRGKQAMFNLLDVMGGATAKMNRWQFSCVSQGFYPPECVEDFMCSKHLHPGIERMFDGLATAEGN